MTVLWSKVSGKNVEQLLVDEMDRGKERSWAGERIQKTAVSLLVLSALSSYEVSKVE